MAKELWACKDPTLWAQALREVPRACVSVKAPNFADQDRWYNAELPASMVSRTPPHITKDEVVKLVEWKMARGKWRPSLLGYAKQQNEEQVALVTAAGLKAIQGCGAGPSHTPTIKAALDTLTQLKGVGPATASAMLAAACAHSPFMSDEALEAALGKRDYTAKAYLALTSALQVKALDLNSVQSQGGQEAAAASAGDEEHGPEAQAEASGTESAAAACTWTASSVEKALWVASVLGMPPYAVASAPPAQAPAAKAAARQKSRARAQGPTPAKRPRKV